jgi:hypothetical protein
MVRTEQSATAAILPIPTFENPIAKYEVGIKQLEDLLAKFRYDQDDQTTLNAVMLSMRRKWANLSLAREEAAQEA